MNLNYDLTAIALFIFISFHSILKRNLNFWWNGYDGKVKGLSKKFMFLLVTDDVKLWPKMERAPCPCLRYCIVTFATSPTTIIPCFIRGIWVEIKRRGLHSSIECQSRLLPTLFCVSHTLHIYQLPTCFLHWSNLLADPLAPFYVC